MTTKASSTACFFQDFAKHLPVPYNELSQSQFLARCKAGKAPPSYKAFSQKDRPQWTRASISAWWQRTFAQTHPDSYKALLADGFPEPPKIVSPFPVPKTRRQKSIKKKVTLPSRDERTRPNTVLPRSSKPGEK